MPDDAKAEDRLIYTITKNKVVEAFTGLSLEFQANDLGDLDYMTLMEEIEKGIKW